MAAATQALRMAAASVDSLREAFVELTKFLAAEPDATLDLDVDGNVMLDSLGRLKLSDPVTMATDRTVSEREGAVWVMAELPTSWQGSRVRVDWRGAWFLSELSARQWVGVNTLASFAGVPGLEERIRFVNQAEALELLNKPSRVVGLHEWGGKTSWVSKAHDWASVLVLA